MLERAQKTSVKVKHGAHLENKLLWLKAPIAFILITGHTGEFLVGFVKFAILPNIQFIQVQI